MASNDAIKAAQTQALGGGGPAPPRGRQRLPLNTLEQVAREIARVYRAARAGDITPGDASRFTFILHTLSRVLEGVQIEGRLERLEAASDDQTGKA